GLFYADEDLDSRDQLLLGTQFQQYFNGLTQGLLDLFPAAAYPAGTGTRDVFDQSSKSWALFTNNSIRFTDALELTLGLRYTDESKDLDSRYDNQHDGLGCSLLRGSQDLVNTALGANGPEAAVLAQTVFGIGCAVTYADPIFDGVRTSQSLDEEEWSGTVKLAYRFTDDVMSYVSYAK